ncbi:unnamed protein product [Hymenolepis diminuta]|uniref:C-CAP/cofactor C-like domain-containing protein n=1 Tax=Hymenolepis diminuta TaxID=6216 RepID=A0A0R3SVY9_HYMDI|nr:unnamed protein product [Hymenolepis diminuta]
MTEVGGSNGNSGSMLPAQLLERLETRDAQRKAAAARSETAEARKRGEATGEHIILPPLNLPISEGEEPIFASPTHNTPSFFLANMARAKALLLRQISQLEERNWMNCWIKSRNCSVGSRSPRFISKHLMSNRPVEMLMFKFGAGVSKKASSKSTASDNVSIINNTSPKKPVATPHPTAIPSEFSLSGLSNRHDLRLPANDGNLNKDSLRDQSLCLTDLTDCKVCITSSCGNLMASRLSKCVIKILRPVGSSVMLQDCVDCRFVLACRQLRVHRTRGSRFDVFVASAPIIEDSSDLLVGPWNVGGDECFSSVLGDKNHWKEVQDFSCPTLVAEKASDSPNWSLLSMDEWLKGEEL